MAALISDTRQLLRDIGLLLGLPLVAVTIGLYIAWPTITGFRAASAQAAMQIAAGTWDWTSSPDFCVENPQSIAFATDQTAMFITTRRPWTDSAGREHRVAIYDLSTRSRRHIRGTIRGEARRTENGEPVVWDLVLVAQDTLTWHRTDWARGSTTAKLARCPDSTEKLIPPPPEALTP